MIDVGIEAQVFEQTFLFESATPLDAAEVIRQDVRDWSDVEVIIDTVDIDLPNATVTYSIKNTDAVIIFHGKEDGKLVNKVDASYGLIYWRNGVPKDAEEFYERIYVNGEWPAQTGVLYTTRYVLDNAYLVFDGYPENRLEVYDGR